MKKTIGFREFKQSFEDYGRETQFPEGLETLFDHIESLELETGEEIELDVIALCCDYTEGTLSNVLEENGFDRLSQLENVTTVLRVNDDEDPIIIYGAF